ncbi:MAG: hypothetical protein A3E79_09090 [Burkholderiales bacterium RIFCSPHIGHO2_12_FULL_61_11]|nr:MAG: hypothetical protein A3E79_09090 [Burkholderiales bacterium RIFCSPHIGHO2_12_FULL_61_11]
MARAYRSLGELGTVMLGSPCVHDGVRRVASAAVEAEHEFIKVGIQMPGLDRVMVYAQNSRTNSSRGMLFYRLRQQAVVTAAPVTYGDVVSKN